MIAVLCGGVGAARLLRALRFVHEPSDVVAIVNVADDVVMHGLTICPDLDTITYTLAGLNNEELGWGLAGESWRVMSELESLGGDAWFRLGDRDLATHLFRTARLAAGATKSEVTTELTSRFQIPETVIPVTNDPLATMFSTEIGEMGFQQYFVQHHHSVAVSKITITGADVAEAAPGVLDAIGRAERVVIAPSNPLISIAPILAVSEVSEALAARRSDVVAISPIVGGRALKGPADRLLNELGHSSSSAGVAAFYRELAATLVIDEIDAADAGEVLAAGVTPRVTTTVMSSEANCRRLAQSVLA